MKRTLLTMSLVTSHTCVVFFVLRCPYCKRPTTNPNVTTWCKVALQLYRLYHISAYYMRQCPRLSPSLAHSLVLSVNCHQLNASKNAAAATRMYTFRMNLVKCCDVCV